MLFLGWWSQHSRYILQNPKLYVMFSFSNNHPLDLAKYLGTSRTVLSKMKSFYIWCPLNSLIQSWFLWQNIKINPTIYGIVIGLWFLVIGFGSVKLVLGIFGITKKCNKPFFLNKENNHGVKTKSPKYLFLFSFSFWEWQN